ncbi:hypothetical protein V8C35DRAFT_277683 [Trichoderma chlorosporum]
MTLTIHQAAAQGGPQTLDLDFYKSRSPHFQIDEPDSKGRTALAYAALKGHLDIVKLLLSEGADVNKINGKDRTALWYASQSNSSVTHQQRREVIEHLLYKGADPNVQAKDGTTALMKLIEHRDPGVIRLLLEKGASTTIEAKKGSNVVTAEMLAEATNDPAVIQAVKGMPLEAVRREEVVTDLITYVLKTIGFMNYTLKGVVKQIFGINGDMTRPLKCVPENMKSNFSSAADVPPEDPAPEEALKNRIFTDTNMATSLGFEEPEDLTNTLALGKVKDDEDDVPAVPLVTENLEKLSAEQFQAGMMKFITETGLEDFFPKGDDFLKIVAQKAVELQGREDNLLKTGQDIQDITKLALYQPVFYCDDSGSMKNGTRQADQIELVRRVSRISTLLVPEGCGAGLHFINNKREMDTSLSAEEIKEIMLKTKATGKTKIGTQLEQKILKPLVYDVVKSGQKLKRPVLVSCITDGCPTGEASTRFKDTINNCIEFLLQHDYPAQAVRFQISQIGNDAAATSFLNELRDDDTLDDVLFCTTQRLDDEYKKLNQNEEDLERWLLQTLMGPITGLGGASD